MIIFSEDRVKDTLLFDDEQAVTVIDGEYPVFLRDRIAIGDSVDMTYFDSAIKSAIIQLLMRSGTPASDMHVRLREHEEEMRAAIRSMDVSKYRTLEAYLDGKDVRERLDISYINPESALLSSFNAAMVNAGSLSIVEAITTLAGLPESALLTPELDRRYYSAVAGRADAARVAREANTERNRAAEDAFLRDMQAVNPEVTQGILDLRARFDRENAEISRLDGEEARSAAELLDYQQRSAALPRGNFIQRYFRRREERSLIEKYLGAGRATVGYIEKLIAEDEKLVAEGKMSLHAYDSRRRQLERRDFTYTPMPEAHLCGKIGQRTLAEAVGGEEITAYNDLSAEERRDVIHGAVMSEASDLELLVEREIDAIRSAGTPDKKQVAGMMARVGASVRLAAEARLSVERDNLARTAASAINRVEALKGQTDSPEVKKALTALLEREADEASRLADYHARLADYDKALAGYEAAVAVGGEKLVFSADRLDRLGRMSAEREALRGELDGYIKGLSDSYRALRESGGVSRAFAEAKLQTLELGGMGGCLLAEMDPVEDISVYQTGAVAVVDAPVTEQAQPERTNAQLLKDKSREAETLKDVIAERVSEKKVNPEMSKKELKSFISEVEAQSKRADEMERLAEGSVRKISSLQAGQMIESVRGATPNPELIGRAMSVYDREVDELMSLGKMNREIRTLNTSLAGFRAARELGREGDLYTPAEIEAFEAKEDTLAQRLEQKARYKAQLAEEYRALAERGELDGAFVEAKLKSIEDDMKNGMTMAEHNPLGELGLYGDRLRGGGSEPVSGEEQARFVSELMSMTRRGAHTAPTPVVSRTETPAPERTAPEEPDGIF